MLRKIVESTEMSNPVKVAYAIKQMAKEAAVGKAVILSSCANVHMLWTVFVLQGQPGLVCCVNCTHATRRR